MSSYLAEDRNVCICPEKYGFCFSICQLSWDTKLNKRSQNDAKLVRYKGNRLRVKICFSDREIIGFY